MIKGFWKNKKVLITGFNGFKGSWMSLVLNLQQAELYGFSLNNKDNKKNENTFKLKKIYKKIFYGDIRNKKKFAKAISFVKPDIVIHLAAQSLVIESYKNPLTTFETNFNGLLNLLEICKNKKITHTIVTSDKCYLNKNNKKLFSEDDHLGGDDPYSASKAIAEILCNSYKTSYNMKICTVRGGNVIGGGDISQHRIVPDIINSIFKNKSFKFRNPYQTRPWQHVIDVIWSYLKISELTYKGKISPQSWNIAPKKSYKNKYVVNQFKKLNDFKVVYTKAKFIEKNFLSLNPEKAKEIGIYNLWNINRSIKETYDWFNVNYKNKNNTYDFSKKQIETYMNERHKKYSKH